MSHLKLYWPVLHGLHFLLFFADLLIRVYSLFIYLFSICLTLA